MVKLNKQNILSLGSRFIFSICTFMWHVEFLPFGVLGCRQSSFLKHDTGYSNKNDVETQCSSLVDLTGGRQFSDLHKFIGFDWKRVMIISKWSCSTPHRWNRVGRDLLLQILTEYVLMFLLTSACSCAVVRGTTSYIRVALHVVFLMFFWPRGHLLYFLFILRVPANPDHIRMGNWQENETRHFASFSRVWGADDLMLLCLP